MRKHIFVINGSGGVGKDTVCAFAGKRWQVCNVSSITPILAVARAAGWSGEKSPEARRFLSQLKEVCTAYNDLSFAYCMEQYQAFLQSDSDILFVHIREKEEIERFCAAVEPGCKTLLIRRPALEQARGALGNRSDDEVAVFQYDFVFNNDGAFDELPIRVERFFSEILKN